MVPEKPEHKEGFFYFAVPEEPEPVLVHGYFCADAGGKFGYGFNTYNGGGFILHAHLSKDVVVTPVDIVKRSR